MAVIANVKEWVLLLGVGVFVGLVFWSGVNVLTLKTVLLWILISFGFLTLLFHAFGTSLIGLGQKVLGIDSKENKTKPKFSRDEIRRRKERSLIRKQATFNDRNQQYKENVMEPKQEAALLRKQKETRKFHPNWKGEGYRLGSVPPSNICSCGQAHEDVDTDDIDPDCLLDYVETLSSSDEQEEGEMVQESSKSIEQHPNVNTLRQRKKDKPNHQKNGNFLPNHNSVHEEQTSYYLCEEPALGTPGAITIALRCPNGDTKKRRFNIETQVQCLMDYVESLGYSSTSYSIMTTYPRKSLSNPMATLKEAGLTHDVVLVIDDIDD